jgi:hypothetical protein
MHFTSLRASTRAGYVAGMSGFAGNSRKSWLTIAVVCTAQFVVVLDVTIVVTALPAIGPAL